MYSLIVFGPIFILFLAIFFSRFMGGLYTAWAVGCSTLFSILFSFDAILFLINSNFSLVYQVNIFPFIHINFLYTYWHSYFDFLTLIIFCLITLISFFIQIFSVGYIGEDASFVRFIVYLCFFMVAILLLVGSSSFFQIFFGWELVGLASYLLINFWFSRQDANVSAYKAIAVNRVGDCFILLSIFIFVFEYQTLEFDLIFSIFENNFWTTSAFLFLIIGAFAKSAQFIFHGWLPDAMEGPTPVSALLHSATMVTAGVFITLRFMEMLAAFSYVRFLVIFFGLLTALYAISIAIVADDTKRATAYTTLNQLGFMFFGCGSLAGATVLFHLIVHGFYKSYSFLVAACELHDLEDEQDGESDSLDSYKVVTIYDLITSLVFISVNAIPFSSPSISKEFMLISGIDSVSDYFSFLVLVVLFASPIDEGRDDYDDYPDYSFYIEDAYVASSLPPSIIFSVFSLGILSIFSTFFLEDFFLDINFYWALSSSSSWITTSGYFFIVFPFISLLISEFDTSRFAFIEDISFRTIFDRFDSSYQSLIFNIELWFYEDKLGVLYSKFFSFSNYFTNQVLDKGYLEYYFVTLPLYFINIQGYQNKKKYKFVERITPYILINGFFIFSILAIDPTELWQFLTLFFCDFTIIFMHYIFLDVDNKYEPS